MRYAALLLIALSTSQTVSAQSPTRAQLRSQIEHLRSELNAKEAQFLAPTPSDEQEYADLLGQPDSGLLRLLPREVYDSPDKLTVRGGGAYYSFSRLTHEYGIGSDIELANGKFSVGFAGADYGFIARLPDQPLISFTLDSPGVSDLAAHTPPSAEQGAREQQRLSSAGFSIGQFRYVSSVPATVGALYVLRSVGYDDADVLVCFQVLRKDDDGSMILAWHVLKWYPKPAFDRKGQALPVSTGLSN